MTTRRAPKRDGNLTVTEKKPEIGTHAVPRCPQCASPGAVLYENLEDHLFGAPSRYRFRSCENRSCQLIWLDPCPDAADIGKLYNNYYTHDNQATSLVEAGSPFRRQIKKAMYERALGYTWPGQTRGLGWLLGNLIALNRYHRERLERSVLWLKTDGPGVGRPANGPRLLDVGCGSGDFLVNMRQMNWRVKGVEPDDRAAELGRSRDSLDILTGDLETAALPEDFFDAVTMCHVVEHLPDPWRTLDKARRLLKKGGWLVAVTPNNRSFVHRLTRENWRGLETPRHLQVFALGSLRALFAKAGLEIVLARTYSGTAASLMARSAAIRDRAKYPGENPNDATGRYFKFSSRLVEAMEFLMTGWPFRWLLGEELVVVGKKK